MVKSRMHRDPLVRQLAELLADLDPRGLVRVHGAPRDEYESEALDLMRGRQPVDAARAARSLGLPPTRPRLWMIQKRTWSYSRKKKWIMREAWRELRRKARNR
jgi:hypothetical protein